MRKVAGIIATLFVSGAVILLASFLLLQMRTGDPILSMPGMSGSANNSISVTDQRYKDLYVQYGLNLPVFYFTVGNFAVPDSFNYLPPSDSKLFLINLSRETGRPEIVYDIRSLLLQCVDESKSFSADYQWMVSRDVMSLLKIEQWSQFNSSFSSVVEQWKNERVPAMKAVALMTAKLRLTPVPWRQWIPIISFHSQNQFAYWCKGWLTGSDVGLAKMYRNSRLNGLPIFSMIKKPFIVTLVIAMLSMILSLLVSVPAACELVIKRGSKWSNKISNALLLLYSIPVFWIAVVMLIVFAGPGLLNLFPSSGIEPLEGFSNDTGSLMRIFISASYYILPVIALSYGGVIFYIRLLRNGLLAELQKDYIVTARASGYSERTIVYKLALKNAIYSSITLMWITFPALLSGSVLIENVFSIPGMGSLLIRSVQNQDHPVLLGIFMLIGIITSLSFILLDIFHHYFDPRLGADKGGVHE